MKRLDYLPAAATCAFILFLFASSAAAGTIYVKWNSPSPDHGQSWDTAYHTVQAGINAAVSGDEVRVAAGTYVECITLKEGVSLLGGFSGVGEERDSKVHETILDGNRQSSVVTSPPGAGPSTVIDGFTIRNGKGTLTNPDSYRGAGIYCWRSSPTISNNLVTKSGLPANSYIEPWDYGAGIYCYDSSAVIENNTIADNLMPRLRSGYWAANGGAIACIDSTVTIQGNLIANNAAHDGAGVFCTGGSPVIVRNRMAANLALGSRMPSWMDGGSGGAVYCKDVGSAGVIAGNTIVGNSAAGFGFSAGGGIYLSGSSPSVVNNTISGNYASTGGGVSCEGVSQPVIANNIIAFNSSEISCSSSEPNLRNNCVFNPEGRAYSGLSAGTADIQTDPMLVALAFGDVHLQSSSPCINTGWNEAPAIPPKDIDGDDRFAGASVDIGADEFNGVAPSFSPSIVRVSPTGNDDNDGSSWTIPKRTIQSAIDAASAQGGEVWVAGDSSHPYDEQIWLKQFVYLYGGFSGVESARAERDWQENETVLDGRLAHSLVVAQHIPGYWLSALDGFTLQNGIGYYEDGFSFLAGAVYSYCSSSIITNTILRWNQSGEIVYISGSSRPLIRLNRITSNNGSGIRCYSTSSALIEGNVIAQNRWVGISFNSYGGDTEVLNNLLAANSKGIHCRGTPRLIANNTIVGNTSQDGAGMYLESGSFIAINNVIAFNASGVHRLDGTLALQNNNVFGNAEYNYQGFPTDPTGTDGNISDDPLFRDLAGGDYRLRWDSPCIDAGTNDGAPDTDILGIPRPIDGNWDGLAVTDIGAYEYAPLPVTIDVLPGSAANVIQLRTNKLITVDVFGRPNFDVRTIDPLSITFGRGQACEIHRRGHWEDTNADGLTNLVLHFQCADAGIQSGTSTVILRGRLNDGERIEGSDTVTAVAK